MTMVSHFQTGCRNCGVTVPQGYRFYCGQACRDDWYANHRLPQAKEAVMRRIGHPAACELCGDMEPVDTASGYGESHCFEVDHIIPMSGADRSQMSCLHHQDNLRLLCVACHRTVTAQQRTANKEAS